MACPRLFRIMVASRVAFAARVMGMPSIFSKCASST